MNVLVDNLNSRQDFIIFILECYREGEGLEGDEREGILYDKSNAQYDVKSIRVLKKTFTIWSYVYLTSSKSH